jgi:uncharacterized protein YqeY
MRERINAALKEAMLAQDKRRTCTLRLINAAIKDRDIAARSAGKDPVSEDGIAGILTKMIKQRLESARLYDEGHRPDLAEQEREEIAVIKEFLPAQLDEAEMQSVCAEAIKSTGAHGFRQGEYRRQRYAHLRRALRRRAPAAVAQDLESARKRRTSGRVRP